MSGFIGYIDKKIDKKILKKMNDKIKHRGLDYEDYYTCIAVSENLFDNSNEPARFYNGIASGLTYIILKTMKMNFLVLRHGLEISCMK